MANGLFLITYVDVEGWFAIIKLDQNSVREIREIRDSTRHALCLLHGARAAPNEPIGMATKNTRNVGRVKAAGEARTRRAWP